MFGCCFLILFTFPREEYLVLSMTFYQNCLLYVLVFVLTYVRIRNDRTKSCTTISTFELIIIIIIVMCGIETLLVRRRRQPEALEIVQLYLPLYSCQGATPVLSSDTTTESLLR